MPRVGIEPTRSCDPGILSPLRLPITSPGHLETWGGIEPPHRAFAELRLTTWPPGLGLDFSFDSKARQFAGGFFRRGRFQNRCGGYEECEICRG